MLLILNAAKDELAAAELWDTFGSLHQTAIHKELKRTVLSVEIYLQNY